LKSFPQDAQIKYKRGSLIFFLLGILLFYVGINTAAEALRKINWQPSQGVILSTQIAPYHLWTGDGTSFGFEPHVSYQYQAAGNIYQGNSVINVDADLFGGTFQRSKKILEKIPSGKAITIFYDPKAPKHSVIDNNLMFSIFGPVFFFHFGEILLSGLLFFAGFRIWHGK